MALSVPAVRHHGGDALIVPLGEDAAAGDSSSPLAVTEAGYREARRRVASLGLPTVFVEEGGYVLETIGSLDRATLEGFEQGSTT